MKRVLVTGASGWIGQHCLAPLEARGFETVCLSHAFPGEAGRQWLKADLLTEEGRARAVEAAQATHLLHLAWYVHPAQYRESPANLDWLNASADLFERFARSGGRRITGIGSCLEYDWANGWCHEDRASPSPTTLYGRAKAELSRSLAEIADKTGISTTWARIFYAFGPGEAPQRLIPLVVRSLLQKQSIDCSHGRQFRDFLYVEDMADALAALIDSPVSGSVNIASGRPIQLRDLLGRFGKKLQGMDLIRFGRRQVTGEDAEPLLAGDVKRLSTEVNWRPTIGMEAGIDRTIDWWKSRA